MTARKQNDIPEVTADTLQRFGGIARLYGRSALDRFLRARVLVVGIGGIGTWTVEALARSGIGSITLVDLDEICVTNINRQLHAADGQIGRLKTTAMAERVRAIHPACEVIELARFFTETSADEILSPGFDMVVDAIDAITKKALLLAECVKRQIPVITCGGAGGRRDPTRIRVSDLTLTTGDPLLMQTRKHLRKLHGFPKAVTNQIPTPFDIEAVYSDEAPVYPQCDGTVSPEKPENPSLRLTCESGFGTAASVTGVFGLTAATRVLERLSRA